MAHTENLRAYSIHDGEETWKIVWTKDKRQAVKEAAKKFGCSVSDVVCERIETVDPYVDGKIPYQIMLELGWQIECLGCSALINSYLEVYDDSEEGFRTLEPVGTWDNLFCCEQCRVTHSFREARSHKLECEAIENLTQKLIQTLPEAIIQRTHAFVDWQGTFVESNLNFKLPGFKYEASIRQYGSTKEPEIRVATGDMEAWKEYNQNRSKGV